ncbi:hypothetical protein EDI_193320 [Entamoeba dispar SAW760]|uniref:PH domain-containing protein n=1 Tax=Entamoeba dispar (strain ATCC PRA-260 / SAW760) TaxID=370354 RepID=B0EKC8_ENTDS|nr:uncharacterized protein EDI_193320 [Entamoeba dispar SAW760]EDR25015.1 hypothetical protein EDI_193320 [Entamoeba dispar SAW760]|eukprot:EDR25015.1 hypothetical protein EDI_193320 [Entamoeba dispar SAW760]
MSENTLHITANSIDPQISVFWGWKEGGKVKTIKRRWFVLTTNKLFYFTSQNATEAKGCIQISPSTIIKEREDLHVAKEKYYVSINSFNDKGQREFLIYVSNDRTLQSQIIQPITKMIQSFKKFVPSVKVNKINISQIKIPSNVASDIVYSPKEKTTTWSTGRPSYCKTHNFSLTPRQRGGPQTPLFPSIKLDESNYYPHSYIEMLEKLHEVTNSFEWFKDCGDYFFNWFNTVLKDTNKTKRTVEVYVQHDLRELTFIITGSISDIIFNLLDFCYEQGLSQNEIDLLDEISRYESSQNASVWMDITADCETDWGWMIHGCEKPILRRVCVNLKEECEKYSEWLKSIESNSISMGRNSNTEFNVSSFEVKCEKNMRKNLHQMFELTGELLPVKLVNASLESCGDCFGRVTMNKKAFVQASVCMRDIKQELMDSLCNCVRVKDEHIKIIENLETKLGRINSVVYQFLKNNIMKGTPIEGMYLEGNTLHFGFILGKL